MKTLPEKLYWITYINTQEQFFFYCYVNDLSVDDNVTLTSRINEETYMFICHMEIEKRITNSQNLSLNEYTQLIWTDIKMKGDMTDKAI